MVNQIDFSYIKNKFLSIPDYGENIETIKLNIINIIYLYEKTNNYEDSIKNIEKLEVKIKADKNIDKIYGIFMILISLPIILIIIILTMYHGINYLYLDDEKYGIIFFMFFMLFLFFTGIYMLLSKDKKKNDIDLKLLSNLEDLKKIIINNIEDKQN